MSSSIFFFLVELRLIGSLKVCLHGLLSNVTREGLLSIGVSWVAKITLKDQKQELEHFLFVASETPCGAAAGDDICWVAGGV